MASENSDLYKYVLDFSTCSSVEECNARLEAIPGFTTHPDYINNDLNILFSAGDGHNLIDNGGVGCVRKSNCRNALYYDQIITNIMAYQGYHIYSCYKDYIPEDPTIVFDNLRDLNKLNAEDTSYVRIMCFLDLKNTIQMKLFVEVFKNKFNFINTLDNRVYLDRFYAYPLLKVGGTIANIETIYPLFIFSASVFDSCFSARVKKSDKNSKTITLKSDITTTIYDYLVKKESEHPVCVNLSTKYVGGTRKVLRKRSKKRTTLRRRNCSRSRSRR